MPTSWLPAQRQQKIMEFLGKNESISIRAAAQLCGVSEATARRDLDDLAAACQIDRTYGGAVIRSSTSYERVHSDKMKSFVDEKQQLAIAAAQLVQDRESLFLDSGTTMFFLAQKLTEKKNLTIVTNNLDIVCNIPFDPSTEVVVTGGMSRYGFNSLAGSISERFVRDLKVDVAFLGADAVDPVEGVFNSTFLEVGIKQAIVACGRKTILVADHSKFETTALMRICTLRDLDVVITGKALDPDIHKALTEHVKKLILA